jgi:hypothetical protein
MSTTVFVIVIALFIASSAVIVVNLFGKGLGINYWDLDGEGDSNSPPDALDFLRTKPVLVAAVIVMAGCIVAIHFLRQQT